MASSSPLTRRAILKASAGFAGGTLVLPFYVPQAQAASGTARSPQYLRIHANGLIYVTCPVAELGQGTSTGLAMVVADALDADWQSIRFDLATVAPEFQNSRLGGQLTGASTGVSAFRDAYRSAGARAREILVELAARQWGVPQHRCTTASGKVVLDDRSRSLAYGALASGAQAWPAVRTPASLPPARAQFVRKPIPRLDIPSKVDGTACYAVDVRLPRMLYATVVHAPTFGGRIKADRRKELALRRGVRGIVDLPGAVGVVADRWWIANRTALELEPQWSGTAEDATDERISAQLWSAVKNEPGVVAKRVGDPEAALASSATRLVRQYEVPFLAHATMEPMSCVAQVSKGACEIWVCSQLPDRAQEVAARLLGLPAQAVKIHSMLGGGGFGRRQEPDVVAQAVLLAKAFAGRPIKLIWSREQDIRHDFYRPAGVSEMSAGITAGKVQAFRHRQASPSILPRMYPSVMKDHDFVAADGIFSLYGFTNQEAAWIRSETHVPTGMWRSVGASQTIFAIESFVDEVAAELGADPLVFRRQMLAGNPRAVAALDRLAELSGWHGYSVPGRALGLAISHKNGDCLVAQCAEVSFPDGQLQVHRIWTVADPGEAIHPDAVRAQLEGAAIWGLSAALFGKISIEKGAVQQGNFDTYQVVRLSETPEFTTEILSSGADLEGTGEGGAPGIAPAVCNALFRASGKRIRRLPMALELASR